MPSAEQTHLPMRGKASCTAAAAMRLVYEVAQLLVLILVVGYVQQALASSAMPVAGANLIGSGNCNVRARLKHQLLQQ